MTRFLLSALAALVLLPAARPSARAAGAVDFNRDIRPILANNCFQCHGPDAKQRKGKLRLDTAEGALRKTDPILVPGHPEQSELVQRITATAADRIMPPRKTGKKLKRRDIELLTAWVKQGAHYARHWSYVKPVRPPLPAVKDAAWPRNPIDHFLLARLEREGLRPTPEADRHALIRRVTLDLTGLPPTVAEVDAFVNDTRPDAYEHVVNRLLATPAFGEHWARMWLDLARYADSAGYADDPSRNIYAFRDYVIRAFNANKPFDQFTIEQLAGDLLPGATNEQLTATAFHRNTLTNSEGGTNDEEFRNVAIVDRVNTTLAVWMGTSMACAQCHNHKYDPISQEEYFRFFAFLNNTEDADRRDESPLLQAFTPEQEKQRTALQQQIAAQEKASRGKTPEAKAAAKRLAALRKQLAGIKASLSVPIMRELPAGRRRKTHMQFRGNFLDVGKEVSEGVPAAFQPLPKDAPLNRLTLARWLVDANNPLTARVLANRFWEQIFGIGLVRTSEEFGTQGDLPVHPELLDWLATELMAPGTAWDMKAFLRLLVTSAAYRQSSRVTPALLERDPDNRLLARGPRFRLSAEVLHDQVLAVSGLLGHKMYGPSVRPPRPPSGLSAAFGSRIDWQPSKGEDSHRRGLYTEWRRSNPYPSMVTFDAPNREVCILRRARTNTPLQALVTLNDPVYVETAQALAGRMHQGGKTASERVEYGFRLCLSRPPSPRERQRLTALYQEVHAEFMRAPDKARQLAPAGTDAPELAAWTVVANVLLNLDEMFMKR